MPDFNLLNQINSPQDLKQMPLSDLTRLCAEGRDYLIQSVSHTGGHLASNLGVVELTVALHKVFDTPQDKIIWDVGHQCYMHKLLTGRRDRFHTLRQEDGLAGFPREAESIHDSFIGGHSSISISAACGMARALLLQGDPHKVIAVIGDGALTGGQAYEALNNAIGLKNLIVVLNDNNMSISKNVGSFARYLSRLRTRPAYLKTKGSIENMLDHTPIVGEPLKKLLSSSKSTLKELIYHTNFFTDLGFTYFGPADGHDLETLTAMFERAKQLDTPVFIHVRTVKGKGYPYAEQNPGAFHGVAPFNIQTGDSDIAGEDSYAVAFGRYLADRGRLDDRLCAITAAMKYGTGLQFFKSAHPSRFFDVGIAEPHAVTFASGLAAAGMRPVFAVYSSFLQRGYDQVIHDASIEQRHVVLAVDHAGIVGRDGETHQGIFDVSFLLNIPGITLDSPCGYAELCSCMQHALYNCTGVAAVRYPKGRETMDSSAYAGDFFHIPAEGADTLVVTYGRLFENVYTAVQKAKSMGKAVSILKLTRLAPFPEQALQEALAYRRILFFEEGMQTGGVAEHMLAELYARGFRGEYEITAIRDEFVPQASPERAMKKLGLDAESMVQKICAERQDSHGG